MRKQLVADEGGSDASERAVADGLRWLALHQAADGHWGLGDCNRYARQKPWPLGKVGSDDSTPETTRRNDVGGTALALLPFLAAGITHKAPARTSGDSYHRGVGAGLNWLLSKQVKVGKDRGAYSTEMYSHALATIAVCEAYSLTGDARLRTSAQAAVSFIAAAQHDGGGWRYAPRQAGDLSVTGFQVRAIKAAQRAGLSVPAVTLKRLKAFLDSSQTTKPGGYSYTPGGAETVPMTAVGTLCRLYLGTDPGNAALLEGVKRFKTMPPGKGTLYSDYYATQVMFHLGGDAWKQWNLGPDGTGKGGIRDVLIARQDTGAKRAGNKGSWAGNELTGGRLGATSFAVLTLQVYYRYPRIARAEP
jgi:hypothetical protein